MCGRCFLFCVPKGVNKTSCVRLAYVLFAYTGMILRGVYGCRIRDDSQPCFWAHNYSDLVWETNCSSEKANLCSGLAAAGRTRWCCPPDPPSPPPLQTRPNLFSMTIQQHQGSRQRIFGRGEGKIRREERADKLRTQYKFYNMGLLRSAHELEPFLYITPSEQQQPFEDIFTTWS